MWNAVRHKHHFIYEAYTPSCINILKIEKLNVFRSVLHAKGQILLMNCTGGSLNLERHRCF